MVIEFACGEGACGVILSRLGVKYTGVDIAPAAVERARDALRPYTDARVFPLDMVRHMPNDRYDAALDVMGLHMLVTDRDREKYLRHACGCLKRALPCFSSGKASVQMPGKAVWKPLRNGCALPARTTRRPK